MVEYCDRDPDLSWNRIHPIAYTNYSDDDNEELHAPINDFRKTLFAKSPLFVTFEQTIPMRTLKYQMAEGVEPFQAPPHFATPGTAFVRREYRIEDNEEYVHRPNEDDTFWNFPTKKEYGKAISGFILTAVYWDRFSPEIVEFF